MFPLIMLEARTKYWMLPLLNVALPGHATRAPMAAQRRAIVGVFSAFLAAIEGNRYRVESLGKKAWKLSELRRFLHDTIREFRLSTDPNAATDLIRILSYVDRRFLLLRPEDLSCNSPEVSTIGFAARIVVRAGAFGVDDSIHCEADRIRVALQQVPPMSSAELSFSRDCLGALADEAMPGVREDATALGVQPSDELLASAARAAAGFIVRVAVRGDDLDGVIEDALPHRERLSCAVEIFDNVGDAYTAADTAEDREVLLQMLHSRLADLYPNLFRVPHDQVCILASNLSQSMKGGPGRRRRAILSEILALAGEQVSTAQMVDAVRSQKRTKRVSRRKKALRIS